MTTDKTEASLQFLANQAQELDMGYGDHRKEVLATLIVAKQRQLDKDIAALITQDVSSLNKDQLQQIQKTMIEYLHKRGQLIKKYT